MKLKYYMRGLGIGIILTTIILSISFNSSSKIQLSDEEIIKRAEELGMISGEEKNPDEILTVPSKVADNKETMEPIEGKAQTTDQNVDQTKEEMEVETKDDVDVETKDEKLDEIIENNEETGTDDILENPEEDNDSTPQDLTVTIEIKKGMNSEDVASLLKNYGVIEDSKDFNQYLVKKGQAKIINYGVFELPLDASYEQITDVIIR